MKYFLHDTSAFDDEKISELFINFGYEGLGLFYTALEKIGKQEKPIKTDVLKSQLRVGKRLEKCWNFMEQIGLISSSNGESFNNQLLNFSETYQIKKEKTREKVSEWRKKQQDTKNVTGYVPVSNPPKVKLSKVKEYIYSDFYDYQLQVASEYLEKEPATKIDTEAYGKFVRWIFNKDEFLQTDILGHSVDNRKRNLLNMPKQLSFVEFGRLKQKYNGSLLGIFEDMENWKDLKKRKEIYKTALTFINNRTK